MAVSLNSVHAYFLLSLIGLHRVSLTDVVSVSTSRSRGGLETFNYNMTRLVKLIRYLTAPIAESIQVRVRVKSESAWLYIAYIYIYIYIYIYMDGAVDAYVYIQRHSNENKTLNFDYLTMRTIDSWSYIYALITIVELIINLPGKWSSRRELVL